MRCYNEIPDDPKLVQWIQDQKLFHVATAPLNGGTVNVSPKGLDSFKLVNPKACWYLDLTGSGNETISHLYEPGNGRITILFEAFEGPPQLIRLFGKGKVFERGTSEFDKFFDSSADFSTGDEYNSPTPELLPGARAVIWIDITQIATSCGWSVPLMEFISHRDKLNQWASKLEKRDMSTEEPYNLHYERGLKQWHATVNTWSMDGLPGLKQGSDKRSPELVKKAMDDFNFRLPKPAPASVWHSYTNYHPAAMLVVGLSLGVVATSLVRDRKLLASLFPTFS